MRATSNHLQRRLFDLIESKHSNKKIWLTDYMTWANVKKSTAYNHRNGITALTADETLELMRHYCISWRDLFTDTPGAHISVSFPSINRKPSGPLEYIEEINGHFQALQQAQVQRIYFFSNDLPLFYYFRFPTLTAFKFYYWDYAVWGNNHPQTKFFDQHWINQPDIQKALSIARNLYSGYLDWPRTEFWSAGMFKIIEDTLQRTVENGGIREEAMLQQLRQELALLRDSLYRLAHSEDNKSFPKHEIRLNPSVYGNNTVLAITNQGNHVFSVLENPSIMYSNSEELGAYTEAWFLNIRNQSQLLREQKAHKSDTFWGSNPIELM